MCGRGWEGRGRGGGEGREICEWMMGKGRGERVRGAADRRPMVLERVDTPPARSPATHSRRRWQY